MKRVISFSEPDGGGGDDDDNASVGSMRPWSASHASSSTNNQGPPREATTDAAEINTATIPPNVEPLTPAPPATPRRQPVIKPLSRTPGGKSDHAVNELQSSERNPAANASLALGFGPSAGFPGSLSLIPTEQARAKTPDSARSGSSSARSGRGRSTARTGRSTARGGGTGRVGGCVVVTGLFSSAPQRKESRSSRTAAAAAVSEEAVFSALRKMCFPEEPDTGGTSTSRGRAAASKSKSRSPARSTSSGRSGGGNSMGSGSPTRSKKSQQGTPRFSKIVCLCRSERAASRKLVNSETKQSGLVEILVFQELDEGASHNDPSAISKCLRHHKPSVWLGLNVWPGRAGQLLEAAHKATSKCRRMLIHLTPRPPHLLPPPPYLVSGVTEVQEVKPNQREPGPPVVDDLLRIGGPAGQQQQQQGAMAPSTGNAGGGSQQHGPISGGFSTHQSGHHHGGGGGGHGSLSAMTSARSSRSGYSSAYSGSESEWSDSEPYTGRTSLNSARSSYSALSTARTGDPARSVASMSSQNQHQHQHQHEPGSGSTAAVAAAAATAGKSATSKSKKKGKKQAEKAMLVLDGKSYGALEKAAVHLGWEKGIHVTVLRMPPWVADKKQRTNAYGSSLSPSKQPRTDTEQEPPGGQQQAAPSNPAALAAAAATAMTAVMAGPPLVPPPTLVKEGTADSNAGGGGGQPSSSSSSSSSSSQPQPQTDEGGQKKTDTPPTNGGNGGEEGAEPAEQAAAPEAAPPPPPTPPKPMAKPMAKPRSNVPNVRLAPLTNDREDYSAPVVVKPDDEPWFMKRLLREAADNLRPGMPGAAARRRELHKRAEAEEEAAAAAAAASGSDNKNKNNNNKGGGGKNKKAPAAPGTEIAFGHAVAFLAAVLLDPRSHGRLVTLAPAGEIGQTFQERLRKRNLERAMEELRREEEGSSSDDDDDDDDDVGYEDAPKQKSSSSIAASMGVMRAGSSLAAARRKQKLREAQNIPWPEFVAALFGGELDALEEGILEAAEAERQRLMEGIAATRFARETAVVKVGQSREWTFTGDAVDGIFVRELTVAEGGWYKVELRGASGADRPAE